MRGQRVAYAVHSWTGLLSGWLLFVVCLTGTLVVYKFPLKALSNPEFARVVVIAILGPDRAIARVQQEVPHVKVSVDAFRSDINYIDQYRIVSEVTDGTRKCN